MMIHLVLAFVSMLAGCVGPPAPKPPFMNDNLASQIIVQKTTAAEVRELIGQPQQIEQVQSAAEVSTVWTYQFVQKGINELVPALREKYNRPALRSILRLSFNDKQIVQKIERMDLDLRSESEGQVKVPF